MFFQNSFPEELVLNILNRLSAKDAISFLRVSRGMNFFIKDPIIWQKFGAENFEDFVTRMKKLPKEFQQFILKGLYHYNLSLAEDIVRFQKMPMPDRMILITADQFAVLHPCALWNLLENRGIMALREKLLTPEEAAPFHPNALNTLLSDYGLFALRERLLTPAQALTFNHETLRIILSEDGTEALRKKLLTPEEVAEFKPDTLVTFLKEEVRYCSPQSSFF